MDLNQITRRLQTINEFIWATEGSIEDWNRYEDAIAIARKPYVDRMRKRVYEPSSSLFGAIQNPEAFIAKYESELPDYITPRPETFNIFPFTATKEQHIQQLQQLRNEKNQLEPLYDNMIRQEREAFAQQLQALEQQAPMDFDEEPQSP